MSVDAEINKVISLPARHAEPIDEIARRLIRVALECTNFGRLAYTLTDELRKEWREQELSKIKIKLANPGLQNKERRKLEKLQARISYWKVRAPTLDDLAHLFKGSGLPQEQAAGYLNEYALALAETAVTRAECAS